jgi:hypothetical protein
MLWQYILRETFEKLVMEMAEIIVMMFLSCSCKNIASMVELQFCMKILSV